MRIGVWLAHKCAPTIYIYDKNTRREGVLKLSLEALFKFILLESKDLFIYLFLFLRKKEKNRRLGKKYGLPPGSACLWSKARPWEPLLDVAASLVLWLPPSPISGLNS